MKILAGDIGGTKTRLALFDSRNETLENLQEQTYVSRQFSSLDAIIDQFLAPAGASPDAAGFGLAGPVHGRSCRITNLPWHIDADAMESRLGIPRVILLNDLEATAWGIGGLKQKDFLTLQEGTSNAMGNRMVIAAGTGLGQAGIFWDGARYHPFATEGGHCDFSPRNDLEFALHSWLGEKYGHVSWERVLSGPGLVDIHSFLCTHTATATPSWLADRMGMDDPAAVISQAAEAGSDQLCIDSLKLFVRLYGVETGNQALKTMATGGVFIGGGIAPRIIQWLKQAPFIQAFNDKGSMSSLMERMKVKVILNDKAALYGSALRLTARPGLPVKP
ncbi:MAG: glucokinase [Gammaproteobacteria bacterium]|nr:glucokinase [Gammaproteobacteria bacterium]